MPKAETSRQNKPWTLSALLITLLTVGACGQPSQPTTEPTIQPSILPTPSVQPNPSSATPAPVARSAAPTATPTASPSAKTVMSCAQLKAGTQAETALSVDLWPWGAESAVSLTIDEGLEEPYTILMPEIELRGWRATFYIYTLQPTLEKTWDKVVLAQQRGHEVSNHTHNHPNMTKLTPDQIHYELRTGNEELHKHLGVKVPLQSFAYPYEATNPEVSKITLQYHRYARAGDHGAPTPPYPVNDAHKPDFGALKAKAPTRTVTLSDWNQWIDATVAQKGWFIEELHGVEDIGQSGGWEPRTIEDFRKHFDHIESFGGKVWVAPVQNVGNYIEERESAKMTVNKSSAQGLEFTLADAFDNPALTEPLTILVKLPAGWQGGVNAQQNNQRLEVRPAGSGAVRISALPDPAHPVCLLPQ